MGAPGDVLLPSGMLLGCVGSQIYRPSEDDAVTQSPGHLLGGQKWPSSYVHEMKPA